MLVMFIKINRSSEVPLYLQIRRSVRDLIVQGTLRPGERLLSTRELAENLAVNRTTIEAAFSGLEADGLIRSHMGSGTFVHERAAPDRMGRPTVKLAVDGISALWAPMLMEEPSGLTRLPTRAYGNGKKAISLLSAAPGPELFPAADFRRCADFVLKRRVLEIGCTGPSDGLPSLKFFLLQWLRQNGMTASEDEVLITTGCQQSMDLIRRMLVRPGDSIILENPTYPGAVAALAPGVLPGVQRLELPIRNEGPDLPAITSLLNRKSCKLIYLVPNFHNPTGQTMSLQARHELVALARQFRIPIIEDDVFGHLRYGGAVLPTLRSLCPELVIYISSFSKMLTPGLRLGWMLGPRPVIQETLKLKQSTDLQTNLLIQAIMDEFCRRNLLNQHIKRMRRIFKKRRDAMANALQKYFPSDSQVHLPAGGLSIWITLPDEFNTTLLQPLAAEQGVRFLPGSTFYFRHAPQNSLRLSFAEESERRIEGGVQIIGSLLGRRKIRAYVAGTRESTSLQPVF